MANIQSISKGYRETSYVTQYTPATGKTLVAGDIVFKTDETTVDKGSLANDEDKTPYMILEGNDTYSGKETGKVVCLSGLFETTVTSYQTGSYTVDAPLTVTDGKFALKTGTKKTVAHVLSFSLSQGLKVRFNA
jgi:hypothetical protein